MMALLGLSSVALADDAPPPPKAKSDKPAQPTAPKPAADKSGKPDPNAPPSNIVEFKPGPNVVTISDIHMVVTANQGPPFRVIDLDAYVEYATKEDATKAASQKKAYEQAIRDSAKEHSWTEFKDPANGVELAREIVTKVMDDATPGIKAEDVYVQSLMLH